MTDRILNSPNPGADQHASLAEGSAVKEAAVGDAKLLLVEEALQVSNRAVVTGKVRVSTRTETYEEVADVGLDRDVVDVTRVPVGRVVEVAPTVRTEDDTVIVPVLEERYVVVRQIFLKEELHIRRRVEHEVSSIPVELRRQVAVVERLDAQGHPITTEDGVPHPDPHHAADGVNRGESNGHS